MTDVLAHPPTVIVLAAGRSERFKQSVQQAQRADLGEHKLHALLNGQTVLEHVLTAVRASGLPFFVVQAEHTLHIPHAGMGDSIAVGVQATESAHGWLVLPADLPLIQANSLLAVAQALQNHAVVVPFFQNQKGHPVGFDRSCQHDLMHLTGDRGASAVVNKYGAFRLTLEDLGCVLDVDTVEIFSQVEKLLRVPD